MRSDAPRTPTVSAPRPGRRPLLALCLFALAGPSMAASCAADLETRAGTAMKLPYREFDQSERSGWRPLADAKCYLEAAELIRRYILAQESPDRMLYWHQAQSLAFGGKPGEAAEIASAHALRDADDILKFGYRWNAFALATIAYWRTDRTAFLEQKRVLSAAVRNEPGVPAAKANQELLDALDRLDRCFRAPYAEAVDCPR